MDPSRDQVINSEDGNGTDGGEIDTAQAFSTVWIEFVTLAVPSFVSPRHMHLATAAVKSSVLLQNASSGRAVFL